MTRVIPSTFQKSVWNGQSSFPQPSTSSFELLQSSSWSKVPEERPSSTTTPQTTENRLANQRAEDDLPPDGLGCCSTWPRTYAFVLALCVLCAAIILVPIILINTLGVQKTATTTTTGITTTTSSSTSTTTTTTITTTTAAACGSSCVGVSTSTLSRLAFYSFDTNTNDITGTYSASGISYPSYSTGYVSAAISFDATAAQRLSAPSMSLSNQDFTIELWFYLSKSPSGDNAFFGQQNTSSTSKCLFLMDHAGKLYMGFFNSDLSGNTSLQNNTWYHATFVYDYSVQQKRIYLNGNFESQASSAPYIGTPGAVTIGGATIYGSIGVPYYSGLIDHLTISTRIKSDCEILNDATLAAYFTFDTTIADSGPNFLTATSSGASATSGVVNQAAYLSGSNSYIQIGGLTGLGRPNQPFSIAFWVYPVVNGVLIHVSGTATGLGWCTQFMGFNVAGNLITQVYYATSPYILTGPVVTSNVWTHIVQTYSPTNGQNLYINGSLSASLPAAVNYDASAVPNFFTIGNLLSGTVCYTPTIIKTVFQGSIDELRIFSREITAADACTLSRP